MPSGQLEAQQARSTETLSQLSGESELGAVERSVAALRERQIDRLEAGRVPLDELEGEQLAQAPARGEVAHPAVEPPGQPASGVQGRAGHRRHGDSVPVCRPACGGLPRSRVRHER